MQAKILIAPYIVKQKKVKIFHVQKNAKIIKQSHGYKGYASVCSVEILNSFNPELQLRDTVYAIRNKLVDVLAELKDCKFLVKLVLEFKK